MLSIKAICKSENNKEVVIIGFESEGYCICMTKSGTIFHAKHEDLTIVDKEYMESCAKESIDFEMAYFLEKASARLDQIQRKQLTSIILELQEYRSKIEQGKMIELPCKVGTMAYYIASYKKKNGFLGKWKICYTIMEFPFELEMLDSYGDNWFLSREEAEKRLKELQDE